MAHFSCARAALLAALGVAICSSPVAGDLFVFSDASGLSAEAEFVLVNGTTLQVRLKNTSTGVPDTFDNADQILTGLSWDFGPVGSGDVEIISGSVMTGPNSATVNFDVLNLGSSEDVSGEWGFGNKEGSGALTNFISAHTSHATPFGGLNLDGPESLSGPQGGLISSAFAMPLGGLGAIQDEIIATLTLSRSISDLSFLRDNPIRIEFGSDAFFITIPAPATAALLLMVPLVGSRRRR